MRLVNTRKRSNQREILDDFDLHGKELEKNFDDLDRVNKLLGGYTITLQGIEKVLGSSCFRYPVSIVDVGCGNGSMLREVAKMGREKGIKMHLKGIDANPFAVEIARNQSKEFPEIFFEVKDVTSNEMEDEKIDIILCTLTLHHFNDSEIKDLIKTFLRICHIGIVINDLHRSKLAYYLFEVFSRIFIRNEIARKDGLTSVLRSFKREDFEKYGKGLKVRKQSIVWKWAFRYQWILIK